MLICGTGACGRLSLTWRCLVCGPLSMPIDVTLPGLWSTLNAHALPLNPPNYSCAAINNPGTLPTAGNVAAQQEAGNNADAQAARIAAANWTATRDRPAIRNDEALKMDAAAAQIMVDNKVRELGEDITDAQFDAAQTAARNANHGMKVSSTV